MSFGKLNDERRDQWLAQKLRNIPNQSRILDAGAGELRFKKYCSHLNYVSQDFGGYDGKGNNEGLQTGSWDNTKLDIVCDICHIPEPNESFDAILCTEVFEHIANPVSAIREFTRLLRPNGHLILTAPFCSLTHFAPYHFYSGFNSFFYQEHLKNDFDIIEIVANGNYYEYLAQELFRIKYVTKTNTLTQLRLYERLIFRLTISLLGRISKKDYNSSTLLNYGYFILAQKK